MAQATKLIDNEAAELFDMDISTLYVQMDGMFREIYNHNVVQVRVGIMIENYLFDKDEAKLEIELNDIILLVIQVDYDVITMLAPIVEKNIKS